MLILGLPLIVDVVSLFASAGVWIFYFGLASALFDSFRANFHLLMTSDLQSFG